MKRFERASFGPKPRAEAENNAPLLLIVSKDQSHLFGYLQKVFADVEQVRVIADRRGRQRRRPALLPGAPEPNALEPRRAERRTAPSLDGRLALLGWVVAPLR
jgi:hypothetical protein